MRHYLLPQVTSCQARLPQMQYSCRSWFLTFTVLAVFMVTPMIGENRQLVTNEPVEVQDCRKITDRFRGIYRIYPNFVRENQRMSTCNRLDLQTLGSQLILPRNLPDHWVTLHCVPRLLTPGEIGMHDLYKPHTSLWSFVRPSMRSHEALTYALHRRWCSVSRALFAKGLN